ncbi:MAG: ATP-binding cassette domain-containing protein [Bacteroidaceae bacterium]|nr:ATP-binding cassette domain-containing protein [Bacteroidaceae bacterium]
MQKIVEIKNGVARHPLYRFKQPVNFEVLCGEHIAIVGPNGGGKSMLVDILTGAHALQPMNDVKYDFRPSKAKMVSDNIKYMTFRDSYGTTDGTYYYQQRWNQNDIDETPLVSQLLDEAFVLADTGLTRKTNFDKFVVREESPEQEAQRLAQEEEDRRAMHTELEKVRRHLYEIFHLEQLLDKHIVMLSSGELRKFQLTKTLMTNPRVLIMDNPFIGLDVKARQQLHDFLKVLIKESNITVILVLSKTDDIPSFITHVYRVEGMTVLPKQTLAEYRMTVPAIPPHVLPKEKASAISALSITENQDNPEPSREVIAFNNVNIRYGTRTILKDLSFTVKQGEHWALSGENGSGKSTLLSLVCADNPQAYANDITLFGHKRGSGESIWDIKRHIGYISPEMHRAYQRDIPAIEIVASGLSDMNGLYVLPKLLRPRNDNEQFLRQQCLFWMDIFGVEQYADQTFLKLSSGEQRLVLLARAFVKAPSLLILDEPLHGLDLYNRRLVKDVIETFCQRKDKTLIMVTHYQEELPACIDHSIYLQKN